MLQVIDSKRSFERSYGFGPLSFTVSDGSTVALVGKNGAGKTTLLRAIAGIDKTDGGSIFLDNMHLCEFPRSGIGYLSDTPLLLEEFTLHEMCEFDANMRGINLSSDALKKHIQDFECSQWASKKIKSYSLGMKKRAGLICAFLGSPRIVILDEPLNALDVHGVILLKQALRRHQAAGGITLLSCHILSFVAEIKADIIIMKEGKIQAYAHEGECDVEELFLALS